MAVSEQFNAFVLDLLAVRRVSARRMFGGMAITLTSGSSIADDDMLYFRSTMTARGFRRRGRCSADSPDKADGVLRRAGAVVRRCR
jgi:hypothetical protein